MFSKNATLQCNTDLIQFSPSSAETLNVDKTQCLVMNLEIFPETGDVEIICPRANNTVNSTEYFGTSPIDDFNGS